MLLIPLPLWAQDDTRLERLIQDTLSDGAARQVDLQGFRGALSSQASLDLLTIADADGVWLRIENAELDWTQSALLRGRLEIAAITAERIVLTRLPQGEPAPPSPEATPFALPELPVSIEIGEAMIAELELGPTILGQPVFLSAQASLGLAGGEGRTVLSVERLDGDGQISLNASYANDTNVAEIVLDATEGPGGILVSRLQIDGAPALGLTLQGGGPLDAFAAEFALSSDGVARLSGTAQSRVLDNGDTEYDLDLVGDLRPLASGDLEQFLGEEASMVATARQSRTGALTLDPFAIRTAALQAEGRVALDAQRQPEGFSLEGVLEAAEPQTRLALPGGAAEISSAQISLEYDRNRSDAVNGIADLVGLTANGFSLPDAQVALDGRLTTDGLIADVTARAGGLGHEDEAIAEALGEVLSLQTQLEWTRGDQFALQGLELLTDTLRVTGDASLRPSTGALDLAADIVVDETDLRPFSGLAGRTLSGTAGAGLSLQVDPLSGLLSADIDVAGQNLELPGALPRGLLAGETFLTGTIARDTGGLRLETFRIAGQELSADLSGQISSTAAEIDLNARLRNGALLSPAIPGPVELQARVDQSDAGPYGVDASLLGPRGIRAQVSGTATPELSVNLQIDGGFPMVLANAFIAPQTATGQATFDLAMRGAPGLDAISGTFRVSQGRIGLPSQGLALNDLLVRADISSGRANLDLQGSLSSGGTLQVSGPVGFGDPALPARLDIRLDQARLVDAALYDAQVETVRLIYSGELAGATDLSGDIAFGPVELRVPESGVGGAGPIPDITHVGETAAARQTRAFAGLLARSRGGGGSAVGLNINLSAPGRVFLRGRGLDAELGGTLSLTGSSAAVVPSGGFELIRGRLSLLGQRFDLTEGLVTLQGSDPYLRLSAETSAGDYTVFITVEGLASAPEVSFRSSPELPEDEVLAQLFFGRSVSTLSAVQALQLADGVAGLAGGNSGVFSRLREGLGLDDLDVSTDDSGNAAVRAGAYLSDNVYTDVTVENGGTGVSLNIDLTPSITARGAVSSDGDSSLGIFFERDY